MYLQSVFQFGQPPLSQSTLSQFSLSQSAHQSTDPLAQQMLQQIFQQALQQALQQTMAQPNLILASTESPLDFSPLLTINLLLDFEQPQSVNLSSFSISSAVISRSTTHSSTGSHLNDSALNDSEAALLETSADYILPVAAAAVTPTYLYQDFIWKPEPAQPWNLAGVALIGLAILPGLWLSYLGLSANPLLHQKLMLLGIELLLIGFQLFCFSLAMALLIETHQSFPSLSK